MPEIRVLYIIPTLGGGGAERSLFESIRHSPADVVAELLVFSRRPGDLVDAVMELGVPVTVVGSSRFDRQVKSILEVAKRFEPDLLHVSLVHAELPARFSALMLRRPLISVLASTTYDRVRRSDPAVSTWRLHCHQALDAATAHLCVTHFRAVSESAARDARIHLGVPRRRITVIPRGRPRETFTPIEPGERDRCRAALGLSQDAFVVGSVSRRDFSKAIEVLVESNAILRARGVPAVFVHAGGAGNAERSVLRAIETFSPACEVILLGPHDSVVRDVLPAIDVFGFPSRYEGLPGALMEAAGRRLPIVASDIGPNRDLLGDAAVFVPRDDAHAFADALYELYASPVKADALAERCHRFVAGKHVIDDIALQEIDLYRAVAGVD